MVCQTHNHRLVKSTRVVASAALISLTAAAKLPAQIVIRPGWSAPSGPVWVIPQPAPQSAYSAYSTPTPHVTHYPSADGDFAPKHDAAEPPANGHLRVTIAESLLTALLGREITDSGPIQDCVLGADVYGSQFTVTRLSVDCLPCDSQARLLLRLTGFVTDQTVGVTRPAAVRSQGSHQFQMAKQVDFDGCQFTTRSPEAWVAANIVYRDVLTVVSGVPVIGQIGTAIALSEAERRRPAAVQFALRRITGTAAPRFNQEVDGKLSRANHELSTRLPAVFEQWGLSALDQSLATTDDRLVYCLAVPTPPATTMDRLSAPDPVSDLSGPVLLQSIDDAEPVAVDEVEPHSPDDLSVNQILPPPPAVQGGAMTIMVHEDFVNHLLGQLSLEGREVPDRWFSQLMGGVDADIFRRLRSGDSSNDDQSIQPEYATLLFDADRPVSVRFEEGQVIVTLRTGFRVLVGGEVPKQRVEISFRVSTDEHEVTWDAGEVTVSAVATEEDGPLAALARPVIRQQIQQRLQPGTAPRAIPLEIPGMRPVTLNLREIALENGWLALALD